MVSCRRLSKFYQVKIATLKDATYLSSPLNISKLKQAFFMIKAVSLPFLLPLRP